jgi:uncharacterized coiled-coil DUF342 family protein
MTQEMLDAVREWKRERDEILDEWRSGKITRVANGDKFDHIFHGATHHRGHDESKKSSKDRNSGENAHGAATGYDRVRRESVQTGVLNN